MATLTYTSPKTLQEVLTQLNLSQYHDALIQAGYDRLNCFDMRMKETELTEELKQMVPMKYPHARKLVRYLLGGYDWRCFHDLYF